MRKLHIWLATAALLGTGASSSAGPIYRCQGEGTVYSQQPCGQDAVALQLQDPRSQAQQARSLQLAAEQSALVRRLQAERLQREQAGREMAGRQPAGIRLPAEPAVGFRSPTPALQKPGGPSGARTSAPAVRESRRTQG